MTNVEPRATDRADRIDTLLVLGVLFADTVLLAIVEVMYVSLSIGATPLPLSSVVALVSTPWLVRRAGELGTGTRGAVLVFLGWTGVITVLGLGGPGGDVLLPGDWPSIVLVVAGLFPGALALGRVIRLRRDADLAVLLVRPKGPVRPRWSGRVGGGAGASAVRAQIVANSNHP